MFDNYITADQKRSLIMQRLQQFAAEGYQHQLNKQLAEATNNTEAVEVANAALEIINTAIATHESELATLGEPQLNAILDN